MEVLTVYGVAGLSKYGGQYGKLESELAEGSKYYSGMSIKDKIKFICKQTILDQIVHLWKKKQSGVHWLVIEKPDCDRLIELPYQKKYFGQVSDDELNNIRNVIDMQSTKYRLLDLHSELVPDMIRNMVLTAKRDLLTIVVECYSSHYHTDIEVFRAFDLDKTILFGRPEDEI